MKVYIRQRMGKTWPERNAKVFLEAGWYEVKRIFEDKYIIKVGDRITLVSPEEILERREDEVEQTTDAEVYQDPSTEVAPPEEATQTAVQGAG